MSVSKMKNSVHSLIGLEDSCICDHCLTEFFCQLRLLKTHEIGTYIPQSDKAAVFGLACTAEK